MDLVSYGRLRKTNPTRIGSSGWNAKSRDVQGGQGHRVTGRGLAVSRLGSIRRVCQTLDDDAMNMPQDLSSQGWLCAFGNLPQIVGYTTDWMVEQLRKPVQRVADKSDEWIRSRS